MYALDVCMCTVVISFASLKIMRNYAVFISPVRGKTYTAIGRKYFLTAGAKISEANSRDINCQWFPFQAISEKFRTLKPTIEMKRLKGKVTLLSYTPPPFTVLENSPNFTQNCYALYPDSCSLPFYSKLYNISNDL